MNLFIKVPGYNRPAQSKDMAEILFGNRTAKVPATGFAPREVQGIKVWADPLVPGSGFKLRVQCECPVCKQVMPVGRLAQHAKIHA